MYLTLFLFWGGVGLYVLTWFLAFAVLHLWAFLTDAVIDAACYFALPRADVLNRHRRLTFWCTLAAVGLHLIRRLAGYQSGRVCVLPSVRTPFEVGEGGLLDVFGLFCVMSCCRF